MKKTPKNNSATEKPNRGQGRRVSPQVTITLDPELDEFAESQAEALRKIFGLNRPNKSLYINKLIADDKRRHENAEAGGQGSTPEAVANRLIQESIRASGGQPTGQSPNVTIRRPISGEPKSPSGSRNS